MTTIEVIILGIVQGLTEFLPVSSSGHLALAQHIFGLRDVDKYLFFNIVCHLGTLLAILCYFSKQIGLILRYDWGRIIQVAVGTLPLFIIPFLIKPIKGAFTLSFIGFFFLITAALLFACMKFGRSIEEKATDRKNFKDPIIIGLFQALAVLPGVSRSGSTISIARILGWEHYHALLFSFLLAIPAILGATTFEVFKIFTEPETIANGITPFQYLLAFGISFVVGCFALKLLMKLALKDRFGYFAWYCLVLGLATIYIGM